MAAMLPAPIRSMVCLELRDAEVGRLGAAVHLRPVRVGRGQLLEVRQVRADAVLHLREAGGRAAAVGGAVEGVVAGEDPGPVGLTAAEVEQPGRLDRRLDRFGAAVREEDAVQTFRGQPGDPGGEPDRLVVGELQQAGEELDPLDLLGGDLGELRASVTDRRVPDPAAGGVEVLVAFGVPHRGAPATGDDHAILDVAPLHGPDEVPAVQLVELSGAEGVVVGHGDGTSGWRTGRGGSVLACQGAARAPRQASLRLRAPLGQAAARPGRPGSSPTSEWCPGWCPAWCPRRPR